MRLIKIEDGLLEQEDFFLTSPLGDLIGDFQYYRTANEFTLTSGFVERQFPYENFVIVVEKDDKVLNSEDSFRFYMREGHNISGLIEEKESGQSPAKFLKIIQYAGGIQGYLSEDGKSWKNKGGGELETNFGIQGFSVEGETPLTIKNYSVYRSPYISIYNVPLGDKVQLVNSSGDVINERVANTEDHVELFLEHTVLGRMRHVSSEGEVLSETSLMELKYGDVFFKYDYEIVVEYKGLVLDHNPTRLKSRKEKIVVRNESVAETYKDLKIHVNNETVDEIKISYNNEEFYDFLDLSSIEPQEEIEVYIRIVKNPSYPSWGIRKFGIEIDSALVFEEGGGD